MKRYLQRKSFLTVKIFLFAAFVILCGSVAVNAGSYQSLFPCLIDLSGWTGGEPTGMNMSMSGMVMVNATRSYTSNSKELTAIIMKGDQSFGMSGGGAASQGSGMSMESPDVKMNMLTINGFQVQTVYDKHENSGSITVFLEHRESGGSFFTISYEGISEDEALNIAKQFNWNEIKDKVQSLN